MNDKKRIYYDRIGRGEAYVQGRWRKAKHLYLRHEPELGLPACDIEIEGDLIGDQLLRFRISAVDMDALVEAWQEMRREDEAQ